MLVQSTEQGYIIWLQPDELSYENTALEIECMKKEKRTMVFISGEKNMVDVLTKLLMKNARPANV